MAERQERWPKLADYTRISPGEIYVYNDRAMFDPHRGEWWDPEDTSVWMTPSEMREFAAALLWAAERLESREAFSLEGETDG